MTKELNYDAVGKSVALIVDTSYGIKMNDLVIQLTHNLLLENYEVVGDEIYNVIYKMISANEIKEVSYMIAGRSRSFLLPRNTKVTNWECKDEFIDPTKPLGPNTSPPLPQTDEMKTGYISPPTT